MQLARPFHAANQPIPRKGDYGSRWGFPASTGVCVSCYTPPLHRFLFLLGLAVLDAATIVADLTHRLGQFLPSFVGNFFKASADVGIAEAAGTTALPYYAVPYRTPSVIGVPSVPRARSDFPRATSVHVVGRLPTSERATPARRFSKSGPYEVRPVSGSYAVLWRTSLLSFRRGLYGPRRAFVLCRIRGSTQQGIVPWVRGVRSALKDF